MDDYTTGKMLGALAYQAASEDQKAIIAFGMVPIEMARAHDAVGGEIGRGFAVGLMRAAKMPGGRGMVC